MNPVFILDEIDKLTKTRLNIINYRSHIIILITIIFILKAWELIHIIV